MSKLKKVFIAFILGIVMVFGIVGCDAGTTKESQSKKDNVQSQVDEAEKELGGKSPEEEESAGKFYTLQEAYDNGWLKQEDLMSIAYYHNGGRPHNEEIMSEIYKPVDKFPKSLSKGMDLSIRQTMLNNLNSEYPSNNFELEQIGFYAYYGSYNGVVAIRMFYSENSDGVIIENCMVHKDTIADVKFYYSSYTDFFRTINFNFNNAIMIWKQEI